MEACFLVASLPRWRTRDGSGGCSFGLSSSTWLFSSSASVRLQRKGMVGSGDRRRGRGMTTFMVVRPPKTLQEGLREWGLNPDLKGEFSRAKVLHESPPILEIPNFISELRCRALKLYAASVRAEMKDDAESDLYLNFRVNKEVREKGLSSEAAALIEEQSLTKKHLKAGQKSGFRVQVRFHGKLCERNPEILLKNDASLIPHESGYEPAA